MPTKRDIHLLLKPIVEKRKDLHYLDRHLLIVPVRSIFVAVYFSRSSTKEDLQPRALASPLCCSIDDTPGSEAFAFQRPGTRTWGETYGYQDPFIQDRLHQICDESWLMTDPDYPEAIRAAIENEMLPTIAELATWESAEEFKCKHGWRNFRAPVPFRLAQGDFDWLKTNYGLLPQRQWIEPYAELFCGDLTQRLLDHGNAITADERRTIFARMHEQEAIAIRRYKLEKHWIPTPFPAEERGLV